MLGHILYSARWRRHQALERFLTECDRCVMRIITWVGVGVMCACGGTTAVGPDASMVYDATTPDVMAAPDAMVDAADAGVDAPPDDASDASVPLPDAPYVDFDAASAPWVQTFTGGYFNAVAVDGNLNIAAAGVLSSGGYQTYYVQALNKNGITTWKATATNSNASEQHSGNAVVFDASGNAYVAGFTTDALDVGAGAKGPGGFIVKYDSSGTYQWEYGPFSTTEFVGIGVKSTGNVVTVGLMSGSQDYGGGMLTSAGLRDAVLVEINSSSSYVNAKNWGDAGDQQMLALAIDYLDNLVMTGRFESTINFGGSTMTGGGTAGSGVYNSFVVKLDSSAGYLHQLNAMASSNNDVLAAVSCDYLGNVFVGGGVSNTMNLGGTTLSCGGAVMGELNSSLGHVWSECFTHTSCDGVAADPTGGAALSGIYGGTANFGLGTLPSSEGAYLARFDQTGTCQANYGAAGQASGVAAFLTWPDFVMAGSCNGSVTFPSQTISCSPGGDAYGPHEHRRHDNTERPLPTFPTERRFGIRLEQLAQ
jgi:hypothetical protein